MPIVIFHQRKRVSYHKRTLVLSLKPVCFPSWSLIKLNHKMAPRHTMEFLTLILTLLLIHVFVLQSYFLTNPFLLFHFTSYQTGFYIAARWYFSLNHWTSQRFDHPGHAEKYWRLWLAGINNRWELHSSMQSNNQQRPWQLPALKRKKNWKHIQTIVNRIWIFSRFSWAIIIKLNIFLSDYYKTDTSLGTSIPSFSSGIARSVRIPTWPPEQYQDQNIPLSPQVWHFLAAKDQWSSGLVVSPQLLPQLVISCPLHWSLLLSYVQWFHLWKAPWEHFKAL